MSCCQQLSPHFFSQDPPPPPSVLVSVWTLGFRALFFIHGSTIYYHYILFDGGIVSHLAPLFSEHFVTFGKRYSGVAGGLPAPDLGSAVSPRNPGSF